MRTPTIVGLTALATAAFAVPTAVVAIDLVEHTDLRATASSLFDLPGSRDDNGTGGTGSSGPGSSGSSQDPAGNTSAGSGTSTRASTAQQRGVVMIDTVMGNGEGAGSGMVLSADGTVLTNYHVVDGSTQIRVGTPNGHAYTADVVGHDQSHDVAVLKLRGASGLDTVDLDTDGVALAESVLAVGQGNGEGVLFAATGKVTGTNTRITASDDTALASSEELTGMIRTDTPIVPGYSGGPLFDAHGKVVGIDTAASSRNSVTGYSASRSSGAIEGYAIPITQAKSIADDILAGKQTATNHIGARASLGVKVMPTQRGSQTTGVQVAGTIPGQGAEAAGLEAGDTITAVDGHAITNGTDLSHVMDREKPGSTVKVTWTDGDGDTQTAQVALGKSTAN